MAARMISRASSLARRTWAVLGGVPVRSVQAGGSGVPVQARNSVLSALKSIAAIPSATSTAPRGLTVPLRGAAPEPALWHAASVEQLMLDPVVSGGQRSTFT